PLLHRVVGELVEGDEVPLADQTGDRPQVGERDRRVDKGGPGPEPGGELLFGLDVGPDAGERARRSVVGAPAANSVLHGPLHTPSPAARGTRGWQAGRRKVSEPKLVTRRPSTSMVRPGPAASTTMSFRWSSGNCRANWSTRRLSPLPLRAAVRRSIGGDIRADLRKAGASLGADGRHGRNINRRRQLEECHFTQNSRVDTSERMDDLTPDQEPEAG